MWQWLTEIGCMVQRLLTNLLLICFAGEKGMTLTYYLLITVWPVDNVHQPELFHSVKGECTVSELFCGKVWGDSFVPRPGLRLSCTPACSGLGPGASGRWQCTSRWLCHKPHEDAPMSPRWSCRSGHQPERSLAPSCRLEMTARQKKEGKISER